VGVTVGVLVGVPVGVFVVVFVAVAVGRQGAAKNSAPKISDFSLAVME
jgi:Na+/H+ antiporter NhaA